MRTTLIIDDHVFKEVKRRAVEAGLTVSEFTTLALRESLRKRDSPPPAGRFSIPCYGSGPRQGLSPRELAGLRDDGR